MRQSPLVIDLDGTLLQSDLLHEASLRYAKQCPWKIGSLLSWLCQGKAYLKQQLAERIPLDVSSLPYNTEVIHLIEQQRAQGRPVVLATASHRLYANEIAEHLQLFDRVLATEGKQNLSAKNKRDVLVQEYGEKGFDYAGNDHADLHVWACANHSYIVNATRSVEKKARSLGNVVRVLSNTDHPMQHWAKALRLHQWLKNLLLFVPLLAAHKLDDPILWLTGIIAFIMFGLCASSVYILNDLLDINDDRRHPRKCKRPFAAGKLSIRSGMLVFPLLLATSFTGSLLLLPPLFSAALLVYYSLTLAYSLGLKRIMAVDIVTLALLYTLRIIAGSLAFELKPTFWMLAFSMFLFLSLAMIKRFTELHDAKLRGKTEQTHGRGYYPNDLEMITSIGVASGYMSVLVLALYIHDLATSELYRYPSLIWLSCPLLMFWISRIWLLTHRGQMQDDPVVFAIKDRISLITGLLFGLIFWLAT